MRGLRTKVGIPIAIVLLGSALAGCQAPGDTSGFKPEQKLTTDQVNQQIMAIKANSQMPESIKSMAIKNLEQKLASGK